MITSILTSVKKNLNLDVSYTAFDEEIITHINSAFSTLNQLGVGPADGFEIQDATPTWASFIGTNKKYNFVKTYVYLSVRQLFDPGGTSYVITAMEKQFKELEWRINVLREETEWVDPDPDGDEIEDNTILDGGDP